MIKASIIYGFQPHRRTILPVDCVERPLITCTLNCSILALTAKGVCFNLATSYLPAPPRKVEMALGRNLIALLKVNFTHTNHMCALPKPPISAHFLNSDFHLPLSLVLLSLHPFYYSFDTMHLPQSNGHICYMTLRDQGTPETRKKRTKIARRMTPRRTVITSSIPAGKQRHGWWRA